MTTSPSSLTDLTFDDTPHRVIDELAALALHQPRAEDYIACVQNPPALAAITRHAKHHADEAARFVRLVARSDRQSFNAMPGSSSR